MKANALFAGALVLWVAMAPAWAGPDEEIASERKRIGQERAVTEARFAAEEKGCYANFAVNGCLLDARNRRREAMADLRRQEVSLNDAERRRKGAERMKELDRRALEARERQAAEPARVQEDAARRASRAAEKAKARPRAETAPATAAPSVAQEASGIAPKGKPRTAPAAIPSPKPLDAAANAQRRKARLDESNARRERVEKKQAERTKPPAASLPTP